MPDSKYPLPAFSYSVLIGKTQLSVNEVSGLNTEVQVIEYRDGDNPQYAPMKMSGIPKVSNVTLKRGLVVNGSMMSNVTWFTSTKMNIPSRQTVQVNLLDENGKIVITWSMANAWPVKIEAPALGAQKNEVAFESMELAFEVLTITKAS
jgi:phage tail-like protein